MQVQVAAVTIAVNDMAAIKAFYTEKFGWQILAENEKQVMLKLDNMVLTLCSELLFAEYTNISNNDGSRRFYLTINLPSKAEVDEDGGISAGGCTNPKATSRNILGRLCRFYCRP